MGSLFRPIKQKAPHVWPCMRCPPLWEFQVYSGFHGQRRARQHSAAGPPMLTPTPNRITCEALFCLRVGTMPTPHHSKPGVGPGISVVLHEPPASPAPPVRAVVLHQHRQFPKGQALPRCSLCPGPAVDEPLLFRRVGVGVDQLLQLRVIPHDGEHRGGGLLFAVQAHISGAVGASLKHDQQAIHSSTPPYTTPGPAGSRLRSPGTP